MEHALNLKFHQKKKKMPRSRIIFIICMIAYPLIQFAVFWVYVNFDMIIMSFQRLDYSTGQEIFVGWYNFSWMWDQLTSPHLPTLRNSILNSIYLFLSNNFVLLPISIFFAYLLSKKMPGSGFFRVVFFLPNIISVVVLTMCFAFMFDSTFGPVNAFLKAVGLGGIIPSAGWLGDKNTVMWMVLLYCLWAGIGYNVVLLSGAISRIPKEVLEAGKMDGIGMWREFFCVIIPMIGGTITTLFVSGIAVIFTLFLQPMLLTAGGPYDGLSSTIALFIVNLVNSGQLYRASATGLFFTIISIPVVVLFKTGIEKLFPTVEY
jgi:ABC-type sugar transport system permease subunit